jgi:hypothetical protein
VVRPRRRDPHLLAGVYALDALDAAERERFERHLADCPGCQRELRGLSETAAGLALAAAATPPPGLRDRVFAALPHVEQDPAAAPALDLTTPRARLAQPARRSGTSARPGRPGHPGQPRRFGRWGVVAGLAAAAAAAAIVALSLSLASVQSQLATANSEQHALSSLLGTPGTRIVTARSSVGGTVTAVVVPAKEKMIIITKGLPALSGSRVYQVWLIGPTGIRSAGLLSWQAGGAASPLLATGVRPGDRVGMTVEPAGGTTRPTTKPIAITPSVT